MIILPAIDIRGGKCVRLTQGNFADETVFFDDPVEAALNWQEEGAKFLHVVDLDGAREGAPMNIFVIKNIIEAVDIPVEVGGGIRTLDDIYDLIGMGVRRVILGSVAAEDPELVREAVEEFGSDAVVVGIDSKDGFVAIHGWEESSKIKTVDLVNVIGDCGVSTIICTDISRDGTLEGVNVRFFAEMAAKSGLSVIASGGVSNLDDIRYLKDLEIDGVSGIILGKAIYTGAIDLKEALKIAEAGDAD